ncbi:MAG: hypothetical protein ACJAXB_002755 [Candidatus Endobugula sp.]|jgi:hypothetical protein
MEGFKKFSRFDTDFITNDYAHFPPSRKLSLWWNLIVYPLIFSSSENDSLAIFTKSNFEKWKAIENDIEFYISILLPEILEHGNGLNKKTLENLRLEIYAQMEVEPSKTVHSADIPGYKDNLEHLANLFGDLRYDALADFLLYLSNKIEYDGAKDELRGRAQLASKLAKSGEQLKLAETYIRQAWTICKNRM